MNAQFCPPGPTEDVKMRKIEVENSQELQDAHIAMRTALREGRRIRVFIEEPFTDGNPLVEIP